MRWQVALADRAVTSMHCGHTFAFPVRRRVSSGAVRFWRRRYGHLSPEACEKFSSPELLIRVFFRLFPRSRRFRRGCHGPRCLRLAAELCRRLAGQWSIPVRTVKQDLADLDARQAFDLVLVHGTLHFIAGKKRLNVLARIHRGLRPDGRLVLLFNTSRPSTIREDDKLHVDYAESVVKELRRLAIPLPDSESELSADCPIILANVRSGKAPLPARRCRTAARDGWVRDYRLQRGRDDTFSKNVHGTHFEASLHGDRGAEVFDVKPFNDGRTNLVLVHTPGYQAVEDFQSIGRVVQELAPDIEVFVASNSISSSVTRRQAGRRPSLFFHRENC